MMLDAGAEVIGEEGAGQCPLIDWAPLRLSRTSPSGLAMAWLRTMPEGSATSRTAVFSISKVEM